ncbi:hypothetical protein [Hymenobacter antarcticus]|uniref:Glycosyltransferase RgtA/B/C/D-like domain-containing protein n=1 Tax=Hymenobacter antarcticus TaxID=486270 RepID=A0ABP7P7N9_9BACT
MPQHSRLAIFARVVLLPIGLVLATVAGLGSYYEASDDTSIAWLFSGVLALKPVTSLPLYFRGFGRVLAAAYTIWPGVAWFGLLLSTLLAAATVMLLAVLDRLLRPYLRPWPLALVLAGFFAVALLENWLLFSYVRVALLLAGASVLFAAQRPGRLAPLLLGLAGLGAVWLMRPSLAILGLGAALPAALLLAGGPRRAAPLLLSAALVVAAATGTAALLRTPAETHTQVLDGYFARILDFDQLRPRPRTPADSLGTAAVGLWMMGDSTVVNEALCRRAYVFDAPDFWGREVPAKLALRAGLLVRDYFPLLLALLATAIVWLRHRGRSAWFWLVQLGFAGVFILFAGVLKLPPRLELPLLLFWLLTNLAFVLVDTPSGLIRRNGARQNPLWVAGVTLVLLLYGAKTRHRRQVLGQEQARHELALQTINRLGAGRIRIMAGTNDLLKSLSPFKTYAPGPGAVLQLTGWPSHDASQARLRQALSGTADQTECLRRLARHGPAGPQSQLLWVLTPETATWLSRRFSFNKGSRLLLYPSAGRLLAGPDSTVRVYRVQAVPTR